MRYQAIREAVFLSRDNRFVATCRISGREEKVHVKNTGRCRELLVPGAAVFLEDFHGRMGRRKMRYDLVTVRKGDLLVNMDSQAPNKVVAEALAEERLSLPGLGKIVSWRGEYSYEDSRLDFLAEDEAGKQALIEVKGVTLEEGGHASFPDAPTERGRKHLRTLIRAKEEGFMPVVLFVVQMRPMKDLSPNDDHDPAFGEALREAAAKGVEILARDCLVAPDSLTLWEAVPVVL